MNIRELEILEEALRYSMKHSSEAHPVNSNEELEEVYHMVLNELARKEDAYQEGLEFEYGE